MKKSNYNFVSKNRRPIEDKRFVTGQGNFVADIDRPGMLHVAILACHEPSAAIDKIDFSAALKIKGVIDVITGKELAAATKPLMNGLDTPNVKRYPLAFEKVRYAGEWVCAIVAKSRATAEDASERIVLKTKSLKFVLDSEEALLSKSPIVHESHGSNILLEKKFVWGDVVQDFKKSDHQISYNVNWGRNSTVPVETFGVVAEWNAWKNILDV